MFCNKIEETLFAPLPPSLWADDCQIMEDGRPFFHGEGYTSHSQMKSILPSSIPFRSLPAIEEESEAASYSHRDDSRLEKNSGGAVKSMFNAGCLFTYSSPSANDASNRLLSSFIVKRSRSQNCRPGASSSTSESSSPESSFSRRSFRYSRHRFRY